MRKPHQNNLYAVVGFFALGIFARSFFAMPLAPILLLSAISAALFVYNRFISTEKSSAGILLALMLFSFSLGAIRFAAAHSKKENAGFENSIGRNITVKGIVDEDASTGDNSVKLVVVPEKNNAGEDARFSGRKILVTADPYSDLHYGDELALEGTVEKPENFQSPNGKTFDYISYLAKDGIYYEMKYPKMELLSSGHGSIIKRKLFELKDNFTEKINQAIPAPENSLLAGILLGSKQSLGSELKKDFINTGTIHIVALSGYNVTIVAETIMRFFSFVPKIFAGWIGSVSILLFAMMSGGGATVVRASMMAILVIVARQNGRNYDIGRALILAGFFMLIQNPWILVFDSSFQLSFLATIGLVYLAPKLSEYFSWIPEKINRKFNLRELITATLAAEIFVLPFIVYQTGILSLVALPTNLLILPFIPLTMLFGFYAGIASFVSAILALPFSYISYGLLHYELAAVKFSSSLSFGSMTVKNFPIALLAVIYAGLLYFIFRPTAKEKSPQP